MFGRRQQLQFPSSDEQSRIPGDRAYAPPSGPAIVAVIPPNQPQGPGGFTAGWAKLPGRQGPWDQIGAYAGVMRSQFPAYLPGAQRHSAVEWLYSSWYYPARTALPIGNLSQTTVPNNVSGGQRYGSLFSGPLGPVNAAMAAARVVDAQVRQSGLAATQYAQALFQS